MIAPATPADAGDRPWARKAVERREEEEVIVGKMKSDARATDRSRSLSLFSSATAGTLSLRAAPAPAPRHAMSQPDHPLLAKATDLQTATKARVPGILSLSRTRAAWAPNDPTAAPPLAFEYATLGGALQRAKGKPMLRVPLASGARVFVFGSVSDTDTVVDLLTPLIAREREGGGGGGEGGAPGGASAPPPPPSRAAAAKDKAVAEAKAKLLGEDK